ncbi:MAG TPA: hypothetical protein GXX26_12260 [Clostridiaceae bacterium]|nr:hypothetical protein [Clostridiaceae bacterium]
MSDRDFYFNNENEFVIENYNKAKPFSSFLPAIAGLHGKPLWLYYVNRGQCIATFGINNKDYSIMEFQPANKAYRQTPLQGFRTFLKIKDTETGKTEYYEPFQDNLHDAGKDIRQRMFISSHDVRIEDINSTLGIKTEVMFCTLPGESIASLLRSLKIQNLSERKLEIEIADGMPAIIPYYLTNQDMKNESNLRQAWMGVENHETIPFYRIKVLPYDTPETIDIEGGNFFINVSFENGEAKFAKTIVEPYTLFGSKNDFSYPEKFCSDDFTFPQEQVTVGTTPCAFGYRRIVLPENGSDTSYTLVGSAEKYDELIRFAESKISEGYLLSKTEENRNLIDGIKKQAFTLSSSKEFDQYMGQTFLDNSLRGGFPIKLGNGKHTFYVYSRKHGDLEREYNFFQVDSTYYSQGNSNFRDVNQNRRNDVRFFPEIGDSNIKTFFNLIQLDGFNPLVIKGSRFSIEDWEAAGAVLVKYFESADIDRIKQYMSKAFTPGALLGFMEAAGISLKSGTRDSFMNDILYVSVKEDLADFSEGYWVDHWIYNTDLLEQYLSVYPDKAMELLTGNREYSFYDQYEFVAPRSKKYVLTENGVRQLGSVIKSDEKERMIKRRTSDPYKVRTSNGTGSVYYCTLLSKIITLLVNKIASLDPEGVGVEMESNKPGWCDALNGMPAILGSSINESAAVKRLAMIVLDILEKNSSGFEISVPEEVHDFFTVVSGLLEKDISPFEYWDKSYKAKEIYREKVTFGISGNEKQIGADDVISFLKNVVIKVETGLMKAYNEKDGVYYTYFINEVSEYRIIKDDNGNPIKDKNSYPYVEALSFRQRPIPYFLEGPMHVLRMEKDTEKARKLYNSIKKTGLYDEKLKMYKVNDNIMNETKEIGRQNVFPRGWLENEAVFLHMEYKYLLELLRSGLYEEFFECFKNALIPFQDPKVYGRSILENSSFIASTVHPDKKLHGTGFQSRLTGASAEMLTMWSFMTSGQKPFFINERKELCLEFRPAIPGWLFTEKPCTIMTSGNNGADTAEIPADCFAFNFLGSILTVYHNPERKDTYSGDCKIRNIEIHGSDGSVTIPGSVIPMPYSLNVRNGMVRRIDVYLS